MLDKANYTVTGTNVNLMNAGTYTIKLTQSANLTDVSGMYTIAQRPATITLTAGQSKECETSDPTSFSSTTSHVSDDDHLNYDTTCVPGKNVGHYDLNVALGSKHNYAVRVVDNTFVIIPVQVSAVVVSGSKIYD